MKENRGRTDILPAPTRPAKNPVVHANQNVRGCKDVRSGQILMAGEMDRYLGRKFHLIS